MEQPEILLADDRPELGDPPLEMYSDDNAGSMLDIGGRKVDMGQGEPSPEADPDDLPNGSHEQPGIGENPEAGEVAEVTEPSKGIKKGSGLNREKTGTGSSNGKSQTLGRSSLLSRKSTGAGSPGSVPTPTRPFLKSSSPAAIARRQQEANGNGAHAPSSSTKSNGSVSAPVTPRASGISSRPSLSTTPKTSSVKKRSPGVDTPVTPSSVSSSRRSSMSPSSSVTRSTSSSVDPSRRASLPALSARAGVPSAAELRKWASSSSRTSTSKPTTPGRSTSFSVHSPASVSKSNDYLRRSSPSVLNSPGPKSPGASLRSGSKLSNFSPKSPSTSSSVTKPQVANGSPTASSVKRSSPMSFTKRSPRPFESPTISSRSMSSEKTPSSEKSARRKSLTPEPRDTRLITLPTVDVKAGDDVRLDLRGQKLRSLDCNLVNLTPKLEFVYLRDNKLSNLNGIEILKRVKVLDLSFNEFKGGGFEPLANCKALQQLYLAGNQITSLSGLPQLPNLEFLSVAQNRLKSLAMATQPRLQVLAASKNKISTLKGFPDLPALEHLRLEENPILEVPHLEAASILLVGPTLKKFNDRDLSIQEREISRLYPASTAICIRDGWELTSPEEAAESTTEFLTAQWRDKFPPGFTLKTAFVDRPFEEDPCHCEFRFERLDDCQLDLTLHYQWFVGERTPLNFEPIEGAVNKIYWPKHEDVGYCLRVDCSPLLGDQQYSPVSAFSFPVAPGTGCPKVLSIQVDGEPVEGNFMTGSAEVAWCGGTPGSGVVSWLRKAENDSPVAIVGAEDYEYKLVLEDVGAHLLFMYTPVTEEGMKGEPQYAMTPVIEPASPCVTNVRIVGEYVEGTTIRGTGSYFGGREGASKFEWLREDQESGKFNLVAKGSSGYLLTEEDVGLRVMFVYTPASMAGVYGSPVSATTDKILLAPPRIIQLRLVGEMREGSKVVVDGIFIGGVEGASRVQWFKTDTPLPNPEHLEAISTSKIAKAFRIPLAAVGHYLAAQYTPVRSDGESGEPAFVVSETRVEMLPPSLSFLSITGELIEGELLSASYGYVGGYEGTTQYSWYLHEDKHEPGNLIPEAAGSLQYQVRHDAVNHYISFQCLPVRDDGVVGDRMVTMTPDRISAGSPKLTMFQIIGESIEGAELRVQKSYWGGREGLSNVQWFLTSPDGTQREIRGATGLSYIVRTEDVNGLLCCSCEPVREDGVKGPIAVSQLLGPIIPGPPVCKTLEICGKAIEGEQLNVKAVYCGGEKGPCELEWWRRHLSGEQKYLGNSESYKLSLEDVGARIKVVFIPVRSDGLVGEAFTVTSDVVEDAEPQGKELVIPDCFEDVELEPQRTYFGGLEGDSQFTWYRTLSKIRDPTLPKDAEFVCSSLTYTPELEDVGEYLVLEWTPVRQDGKQGKPVIAYSRQPVMPAAPSVRDVTLKEVSPDMFVGDAYYHGGREGETQLSWYRESADGTTTLIEGATSKTYVATEDDYTFRIIFGYTPVREDGAVGDLVVSEPSKVVYPELPRIQKFVLSGKVIEGEVLTALEVMPKGETQQRVWDKYKKEIKYQWSRSPEPEGDDSFEPIFQQRSCTYKVRLEDIGYRLCCECVITDIFGRSTDPVFSTTQPVAPAFPRIDKLEIDGRGFHTNLYTVRGIYVGGREGRSSIQWFRAMAGSPDLIPIPGETGRMYEANVDDVGYRLVAVYTPVREDGTEGNPTSASTDPIEVEPEVAKEVKLKLELGAVKFEVLRDRDRSPMSGPQQQQALGSLERRVLDINRKRVKVVKPGSKTSFPSTEIRGTYAPPFHVELFRNDQHRLKIVIDSENEVDLMVRTRHIRDVIALTIRGLAQRYNSTPLNLLLKM